jgi:hypothetical protein
LLHRGWRNKRGDSIPEFINFWITDPWLIAEEDQFARERLHQILPAFPKNLMIPPVEMLDDNQAITHHSEIQVPSLSLVGESDFADSHVHAGVIQVSIKDSER